MEQRMRKTGWTKKAVLFLILGCLMLGGCTFVKKETVKLRDLDFTVLSEEKIPEELKKKIEEVKKEPFQFTFEEKDGLYICIGYGQQERSGYSIAVKDLYLTENAVYVDTELLGPGNAEKTESLVTCPYIVLKLEDPGLSVVFE